MHTMLQSEISIDLIDPSAIYVENKGETLDLQSINQILNKKMFLSLLI